MKSILIVEDDITYGIMLKTWLGKQGFNVASASNVARARKHIETESVELQYMIFGKSNKGQNEKKS